MPDRVDAVSHADADSPHPRPRAERKRGVVRPGRIPVDVAISPTSLVTDYIEQLIRFPGALQVLEFADGKVRLVATRADRGGALVGHPLRDLLKHIPIRESRVVAIYRGGKGMFPDGDTVVEEGDEVFFLAARKDARPCCARCASSRSRRGRS